MRFGFKTAPQDTTWDELLAVWSTADDIDVFESGWIFDHFYPIFGDSTGPCLEAWVTLTALAQATDRLRLGSMVNGMPYRHPAVTANMAATLDVVSGGRLELGLGAGWNQEEAGAYGMSLGADLTERFDRFDEGVEAIISLLSQDTTTLAGRHVQLTEARCNPKGPQQPHPPIVIGGGGERRTLRTVARFADHWNLPRFDPDTWRHKRAILDEHCAAVGRDPGSIRNSVQLPVAEDDDFTNLEGRLEPAQEAGIDLVIFTLAPPHRASTVDRLGVALQRFS